MTEWYLAYIECIPHNYLYGTNWPTCICLNHPVMLTQNFDRANNFIRNIYIKCSSVYCEYCSNPASHHHAISKVTLSHEPQESLVHRELTGKILLPKLYIAYAYFGLTQEPIKCKWSFDPKDIPINSFLKYEEYIYPNVPIEIDTWKYPDR